MRENGASIQGHDLKFPLKGVYSSGITESNLKGKKKVLCPVVSQRLWCGKIHQCGT